MFYLKADFKKMLERGLRQFCTLCSFSRWRSFSGEETGTNFRGKVIALLFWNRATYRTSKTFIFVV